MAVRYWLGRGVRFLSAGGVGLLLYYATLYLLTDLAGVWYIASALIASVVNYGSNFLLQKFWTFKNRDVENIPRQASAYAVLFVFISLSNLFLLYVLVEYVHLMYLVAQVPVTIVLTIISYVVTARIFAK